LRVESVNYDAVLEGGGVKLMGHIGAIAAIEQKGFTPSNLAGTSAGAIVAAFRTAGYTTTQMRKLVSDMDFNTFKDGAFFGTKFYHLWRHMGIYKGDVFYQFIKEKLKDQGIERFGDLHTTDDDPRWRYKLKVIASDLTRGRLVILPDDCKSYGIEPDMLEVAAAIRMSMSLPFYFRPYNLNGNKLVDGGILSNFPIHIFDSERVPEWPTFGILLKEPDADQPADTNGLINYGKAIFKTMMRAHDRRNISPQDYSIRLIQVPTGDIDTTDFDISQTDKNFLWHSGYTAGKNFMEKWSWPNYVAWAKKRRDIY